MAIKMEQKFKELKDIVMSAEKYIWPGGREYDGPIDPSGIVVYTTQDHRSFILIVIAEKVPLKNYGGPFDEENPLGVMFADLTDDFNLKEWNAQTRTLIVLASGCPQGSIEGLGSDFQWDFNPYSVLYKAR